MSRTPKPEPLPGEWQEEKNAYGGVRRFRMIGGIKEYEMMIQTADGIEIPESQLASYQQRKDAVKKAKEVIHTPPRRTCPFMDGMHSTCKGEKCALFLADGCALASFTDKPPIKDTKGLICPLNKYNSPCTAECALYKRGSCIFIGLVTESEE